MIRIRKSPTIVISHYSTRFQSHLKWNLKKTSSLLWKTAAAAAALGGDGSNIAQARIHHSHRPKGFNVRSTKYQPSRNSLAFSPNSPLNHFSQKRFFSSSSNKDDTFPDIHQYLPSLTESEMRKDALNIVTNSIQAVDPKVAIHTHLSPSSSDENLLHIMGSTSKTHQYTYYESDFDRVLLVSFGKASASMTEATCEVLSKAFPNLPTEGITIIKEDHASSELINTLEQNFNIKTYEGSHPIPDERSVHAAQQVLELLKSKTADVNKAKRTLLITLISGGGSALFCSPRPPLTLDDLSRTNALLLQSGMNIQQMNRIRTRLEQGTKGGQLSQVAYPCPMLTCILSDVIGDPLDLIASGPTIPDDYNAKSTQNTWKDVWKLIEDYELESLLPEKVIDIFQQGLKGKLPETPKKSHPTFSNCNTILVGNNESAVKAAATKASELGYKPTILGTQIEGEAQHVANVYIAMAQHLQSFTGNDNAISSTPAALIAGGETTVTLPPDNSGKGGRNQEMGLTAALTLQKKDLRNIIFASVGTDGTDGPTDAAGALVDGQTIDRMEFFSNDLTGMQALKTHDAYTFFDCEKRDGNEDEASLSLVKTGPTGTNVADVCVVLIK